MTERRPTSDSTGLEIIGLSGRTGSGKSSAASDLHDFDFVVLSTRSVLVQLLGARNQEVSRPALREIGAEVHRAPGQRWLLSEVARDVGPAGRYVVDGLRFPEDHDYLVERFGKVFVHFHIQAADELREVRALERRDGSITMTEADSHVTESGVPEMRDRAHYIIRNDHSRRDLRRAVLEAAGIPERGARTCR